MFFAYGTERTGVPIGQTPKWRVFHEVQLPVLVKLCMGSQYILFILILWSCGVQHMKRGWFQSRGSQKSYETNCTSR